MKYTSRRPIIILVPYPAQGHVTPMLNLAAAFVSLGYDTVVVTPEFIHSLIAPQMDPEGGISCISIPDGLEEGAPRDFFAIEAAMENHMPIHLEDIVGKLIRDEGEGGVDCVVVDLLASWAIGIANKCGVKVAGFWPAMLATYRLIAAIPEIVRSGIISETGIPIHQGPLCLERGQSLLSTEDLPWLIGSLAQRSSRFKFWTRTLDRSRSLKSLLVNSSMEDCDYKLDDNPKDGPFIFAVGPLTSKDSSTKIRTLWEEDVSCLDWLDNQSDGSVVYVSFGSWVSPIGDGKLNNVAMALEATGRPFILVLRPTWHEALPFGFLERVWKKGKVVSWAPQMEVLKHRAVGCYMTHCGWNSTVEAIQCKKRLLCYPVAGDQFVNCNYIVKVWEIGMKINGFEQKDVEEGIKRVMEDDQMNSKLLGLNERLVGKEAKIGVMASLIAFIEDLKCQISLVE